MLLILNIVTYEEVLSCPFTRTTNFKLQIRCESLIYGHILNFKTSSNIGLIHLYQYNKVVVLSYILDD